MTILLERIREIIAPLFEREERVLVDLQYYRRNRQLFLIFLVDKPRGGITVAECAALNAKLGKLFDDENVIQEQYVLEVSSPGLHRPLATPSDFRRAMEKNVRFFLRSPIDNKWEFIGQVSAVSDEAVCILVDGNQVTIPIDTIVKAKYVI